MSTPSTSTARRDFRAVEPGTAEPEWLLDARWDAVPVCPPSAVLDGVDHLLVLAAHPDDESLGAGGLVAAAARDGLAVTVVVATCGEASHPHATAWSTDDLRVARRAEARQAVDLLGAGDAHLVLLDLPDGSVAAHEDEVVEASSPFVRSGTLVLSPWSHDGHPDHDAVGRAAERLGGRTWQYPVWAWHWGTGDDLPWDRLRQVPLDGDLLRTKGEAVAAHGSQTTPIGPGPGDAPILAEHMRVRFERLVESYVVPESETVPGPAAASDRAGAFDALLGDGDPWHFDGWYERRKRAVTTAVLPRERYGRVLDVGCATGRLTSELAARADDVVAVDVSPAALERAREHLDDDRVELLCGEVPAVLDRVQGAPFDLVVLSEVGYFLGPDEWLATIRQVRRMLAPGGEVLLCHWRHPTQDLALDGPLVHAQAESMLDLPVRVRHEDDDVLVLVLGGEPVREQVQR